MSRLIAFPALALLILFAVSGVAGGRPAQDSVVGGGQTTPDELGFGLSAHSGPAGEDARGRFSTGLSIGPPTKVGQVEVRVTCLNVVDNRAAFGGTVTQSNAPGGGEAPFFPEGSGVILFAIDNGNPSSGAPADMLGLIDVGLPEGPTVCPVPPLVGDPIARGNITVYDASP